MEGEGHYKTIDGHLYRLVLVDFRDRELAVRRAAFLRHEGKHVKVVKIKGRNTNFVAWDIYEEV
jgi:hypothetical protein